MPTAKVPFLAFRASGTIGDSITAQHSRGRDILRSKPSPVDAHSLTQAYRRFLYQHYALMWQYESAPSKAQYARDGAKRHMTAFAQWMSVALNTQPGLVAFYSMRYTGAGIMTDVGKAARSGLIYGATPVEGLISTAAALDGINDYARIPFSAPFDLLTAFTIEWLISPSHLPDQTTIFGEWLFHMPTKMVVGLHGSGTSEAFVRTYFWGKITEIWSPPTFPVGDHHIALTYDGAHLRLYIDGFQWADQATTGSLNASTSDINIGKLLADGTWLDAALSSLAIWNVGLPDVAITQHSKWRYP